MVHKIKILYVATKGTGKEMRDLYSCFQFFYVSFHRKNNQSPNPLKTLP